MSQSEKVATHQELLTLYRDLVLPRRIEERMLKLLRQNKISKWFSGIGQEAIAVGATHAVSKKDYLLPMHRNLGLFTTRGVPLYRLFCQLLGKTDGFTYGRERSFHFGTTEYRIAGMISHLAAMLPVATGIGLASQLQKRDYVALAFTGDGATSEGDFHEALNLAAVWQLPVIFLVENNGYGLSTPTNEQYACEHLADRAVGYGMKGMRIDGNDVLEVRKAVSEAREYALETSRPTLIEAETFRMRGHEEASGTDYVPDELFEEWAKKDPIKRFHRYLVEQDIASEQELQEIDSQIDTLYRDDLDHALKAETPSFDEQYERNSVLAPAGELPTPKNPVVKDESPVRFFEAIQHAMYQAFDQDERFIMMGQDIAEYGGVFKLTEGFVDRFGRDRIRNTPIIESGAIGAAMGLALEGYKTVIEMQFADFISCGFNQIINNLGKGHYRWTPPLNVTIRGPHGAGVGAGPFHSQSPEGWFMQHPGLKVVVPATVEDGFALTWSAMMDPNPVILLEHKKLYRSLKAPLSPQPDIEPLGKARVRREGHDATIVTYGMGVHWALEHAETLSEQKGVQLEVVDLRTLYPYDRETVQRSVKKTNRVLLLEEAHEVLGPMSELSGWISEACFTLLDAPIMRCSSLHIPVPTASTLEGGMLANARLEEKMRELLRF